MKTALLSVVYFFIAFLFIVLQDQSFFTGGLVIKSLIVPVLMILFMVNLNPGLNRFHRLMFAGLFFSWSGDIVLEFSHRNGDLFIPGLVCFLIAHLMYFTVFFITPGKSAIFRNRIYLLIPVILYGSILIIYLYNDLAGMRLPVILYSIVILSMLAGAINRLKKVNRKSYYLVLAGAILFVLSDSAIAVDKFSYPFESSRVVIMSTYVMAQFLIVLGYIKQFREHPVRKIE